MKLLALLICSILFAAITGCGNPDALRAKTTEFERENPGTPEKQAIKAQLAERAKKDAEDGYKRVPGWQYRCEYANCSNHKVKLCTLIRFFGKNDTTYADNCAKMMEKLQQHPKAMDPLRHYFCLDHGRAIVSVPIADQARIEALPDDQRICLWVDDPRGKEVGEQFFIQEITRWGEGCPQGTPFNSHPPCSREALRNEGLFAPELYEQKIIRLE